VLGPRQKTAAARDSEGKAPPCPWTRVTLLQATRAKEKTGTDLQEAIKRIEEGPSRGHAEPAEKKKNGKRGNMEGKKTS